MYFLPFVWLLFRWYHLSLGVEACLIQTVLTTHSNTSSGNLVSLAYN